MNEKGPWVPGWEVLPHMRDSFEEIIELLKSIDKKGNKSMTIGPLTRLLFCNLQLPSPIVVVGTVWIIVVWIVVGWVVIVVNWIPVIIIGGIPVGGIPVVAVARRQPVIVKVMCR